jgi:hypothetical protein
MIIDNFHIFWPGARPAKTYAPLVVNADRVLSYPICLQCLEAICRRNPQCGKLRSGIQHPELTTSDLKKYPPEILSDTVQKRRPRSPGRGNFESRSGALSSLQQYRQEIRQVNNDRRVG